MAIKCKREGGGGPVYLKPRGGEKIGGGKRNGKTTVLHPSYSEEFRNPKRAKEKRETKKKITGKPQTNFGQQGWKGKGEGKETFCDRRKKVIEKAVTRKKGRN